MNIALYVFTFYIYMYICIYICISVSIYIYFPRVSSVGAASAQIRSWLLAQQLQQANPAVPEIREVCSVCKEDAIASLREAFCSHCTTSRRAESSRARSTYKISRMSSILHNSTGRPPVHPSDLTGMRNVVLPEGREL